MSKTVEQQINTAIEQSKWQDFNDVKYKQITWEYADMLLRDLEIYKARAKYCEDGWWAVFTQRKVLADEVLRLREQVATLQEKVANEANKPLFASENEVKTYWGVTDGYHWVEYGDVIQDTDQYWDESARDWKFTNYGGLLAIAKTYRRKKAGGSLPVDLPVA